MSRRPSLRDTGALPPPPSPQDAWLDELEARLTAVEEKVRELEAKAKP